MPFDRIVPFTIMHEVLRGDPARVSNDPRDPGGLTKYGISARYHPGVDIAGLTLATASAIYHTEYWDSTHCGALPDLLGMIMFDACVNPGSGHAVKFLQAAVGVTVDGVFGPATLRAATLCDVPSAAVHFMAAREAWYREYGNPRDVAGFLNRCADLRHFLGLPIA